MRRTPVFARFIIAGAVVGIVAGLLVARFSTEATTYSASAGYGYVTAFLGAIGALLGAIVAVLLDWGLNRDAR